MRIVPLPAATLASPPFAATGRSFRRLGLTQRLLCLGGPSAESQNAAELPPRQRVCVAVFFALLAVFYALLMTKHALQHAFRLKQRATWRPCLVGLGNAPSELCGDGHAQLPG